MEMESTLSKLHEMRMTMMGRAWRDQEERADMRELPFDERFAMLVDAEWDARRVNKRIRLLRQAGFSATEANASDIRYDADRKLDKGQLMELSNCSWIRDHRNVVITGSTGAGKTWLACALGVAACNSFYSVRYVRLPEMLDDLTIVKGEEWVKLKKRYVKCDLLIIDDWLLESVKVAESREILEIVEARNRCGSLLLCSQFAPAGWYSKLGSGPVADAVIDRIVHNSHVVNIQGEESMRKRTSTLVN